VSNLTLPSLDAAAFGLKTACFDFLRAAHRSIPNFFLAYPKENAAIEGRVLQPLVGSFLDQILRRRSPTSSYASRGVNLEAEPRSHGDDTACKS
jgi:hypothetical protein